LSTERVESITDAMPMHDPRAREEEMSTYYDQADIPEELRRGFDV
jgi:hypothetical protein